MRERAGYSLWTFHRLGGRGTGSRGLWERRWRLSLEPRGGVGRPSGWGWDVESSRAGDGLPPGLWFLLGLRDDDGPVAGKNSTDVLIVSRGWCHSVGRGSTLTPSGDLGQAPRDCPYGEGTQPPFRSWYPSIRQRRTFSGLGVNEIWASGFQLGDGNGRWRGSFLRLGW